MILQLYSCTYATAGATLQPIDCTSARSVAGHARQRKTRRSSTNTAPPGGRGRRRRGSASSSRTAPSYRGFCPACRLLQSGDTPKEIAAPGLLALASLVVAAVAWGVTIGQ